MYFDYAIPLALTIIGLLFMIAMIGLQKLLAPRNPFARKLMPYECGEPPTGSACCAIELMHTGGPRSDIERFGATPRASARQSDLMIIAGTLTLKMALRTRLLYDQMPDPKYIISMGSCANCGGLFQLAYSVCDGVDKVLPVDVYVPGCPPRPESLTEGLLKLQEQIMKEKWLGQYR